jgi:transposase-like protein
MRFTDEEMAREYFEAKRWPDGPVCPHCGEVGNAYKITAKAGSKSGARKGLWKCGGCREQFTVTVGTVFEDSHIPIRKWLLAIQLLCSSKKGMSAHQLFRMMGTFYGKRGSYKTAWFMFHRLRFAMTQHPFVDKLKGIVEVDETWVGPHNGLHIVHRHALNGERTNTTAALAALHQRNNRPLFTQGISDSSDTRTTHHRRLSDADRSDVLMKATEAKRLTMRQPKIASA